MKTIKQILGLLGIFLILPLAFAVETQEEFSAGKLNPNDNLYFLDRASESINLALTIDNDKEAQLRINYAKERVAEMELVDKSDTKTLQNLQENINQNLNKAGELSSSSIISEQIKAVEKKNSEKLQTTSINANTQVFTFSQECAKKLSGKIILADFAIVREKRTPMNGYTEITSWYQTTKNTYRVANDGSIYKEFSNTADIEISQIIHESDLPTIRNIDPEGANIIENKPELETENMARNIAENCAFVENWLNRKANN